jgi:uncharacterized protein YjbI with pentapeptide repeats
MSDRDLERAPFAPRLEEEELDDATPAALADGAHHRHERWAGAGLSGQAARDVELAQAELRRVDLDGARLHRLTLTDVRLIDCSLANLDALGADLQRVTLEGCRMTGVALPEARLEDVAITGCRADLANLRFARGRRVRFEDCSLAQADLSGADLRGARLVGCDLRGAELAGALMAGAVLDGCRLDGLRGVGGLRGARMRWADVVELAGAFAAELGIELIEDEA